MLKFTPDEIKWHLKSGIWIGCRINSDVNFCKDHRDKTEVSDILSL